jgi:hypothetical protein
LTIFFTANSLYLPTALFNPPHLLKAICLERIYTSAENAITWTTHQYYQKKELCWGRKKQKPVQQKKGKSRDWSEQQKKGKAFHQGGCLTPPESEPASQTA